MPLLLNDILGLLALPLGVSIGVGLFALLAIVFGGRWVGAVLLTFALVWLWGWSTPFISDAITASLMDQYPPRHARTFPEAGAIVLLGGGVQPISSDRVYPDLNAAADRVWHAAQLYRAGKAPLIIVSGGDRWDLALESEASATQILLTAFGVPDGAIVTEDGSRNTRENAVLVAELASGRGIRQVLLATSAWHMPRAAATFKRVGLDVIPAPTDHHGRLDTVPWSLRFLPSARALQLSTLAFREYLGFLIYRLRGWI